MEQIIYSAVLDLGVYSREIIDMFADSYKNIEVFIKSECLDDQVDLSHDMVYLSSPGVVVTQLQKRGGLDEEAYAKVNHPSVYYK